MRRREPRVVGVLENVRRWGARVVLVVRVGEKGDVAEGRVVGRRDDEGCGRRCDEERRRVEKDAVRMEDGVAGTLAEAEAEAEERVEGRVGWERAVVKVLW